MSSLMNLGNKLGLVALVLATSCVALWFRQANAVDIPENRMLFVAVWLAAAALGGQLYAFGGEHFDQGGGVYADCWRYTPRDDTWEALTPMLTPRHGLGAVTLGNAIYAIGGATRPAAQGTSAVVEVLTV